MSLVKPLNPSVYLFAKRIILQSWYRGKNNYPYLSGDCFADAVDYCAFGKRGKDPFNPTLAGKAKSVFVVAERLEDYLSSADKIGHFPKVLLTGNSDRNFTSEFSLPDSIELWLSQNNTIKDPKILALPIGLENITWARAGRPKWFSARFGLAQKQTRIFVPPMSNTNPIRLPTKLKALRNPRVFDVVDEYLTPGQYFKLAAGYKFVLCLEGNGFENHRIWETLYQNAFPVMLKTEFSSSLRYLGLPILEVEDVEKVTLDQLKEFSEAHASFSARSTPQLWMPFWEKVLVNGSYLHVKM